ncbi:MAG: (E)-4-hydroxy-3-methylbut-2-enyl-diphosphate synthase [Bacteroidetes bacterium]|nr:(E)-4-hydroxy-3-methylbut-2-enyl-diphosphate synthase [Bacteroidota bacterium]
MIGNYKSKIVHVGEVAIGGDNPVRVQSMTSTNTLDTEATVSQSIRMIEAGCELVRITAPGGKEAEHLKVIKDELAKKGYHVPIIADIHYKPQAAEIAANYVEKVRINPGNYTDRKKGRMQFSDEDYQAELDNIRDKLKPLIDKCKQNKVAMRIGSNHGSLSERILLKYGDTPEGMVESAMEFIQMCEELDFKDIILSMKASNVRVMVQANRLLVKRMKEENMNYPIHLGVTEAGDAEDGRLKSAAGIAPLLEDGIGDTVRVSLTEDPEFEIPVALKLVKKANLRRGKTSDLEDIALPFNPLNYQRRATHKIDRMGEEQPPVVVLNKTDDITFNDNYPPDYLFNLKTGLLESTADNFKIQPVFIDSPISLKKYLAMDPGHEPLILNLEKVSLLNTIYSWFNMLKEANHQAPVILKKGFGYNETDDMLIKASADLGYFLIDGLADGIWLSSKMTTDQKLAEISFGILQATRSRISKTEYIACPSCGRTLFNIQSTLQDIKKKTNHLKGLRIGVMGCCVNGPGEMADADYGYVGAGRGKITLYKGKKIMKIGIPEDKAVEALVDLIRDNGDWKE